MEKQKNKFILILTAVTLIFGLGIKHIISTFFPQYMISWYPSIPVFFFVLGLILIFNVFKVKTMEARKTVNLYLMLRVGKILASLLFLLVYWITHKTGLKIFALVFIVFYAIFMFTETYIFYSTEKWIKKTKSDEDSI